MQYFNLLPKLLLWEDDRKEQDVEEDCENADGKESFGHFVGSACGWYNYDKSFIRFEL